MNKPLFTLFLFFIAISTKAQLNGTKWQGYMDVPNELPVLLNFHTGILDMTDPAGETQYESMSYVIKGDTIVLKKLSGGSPCDINSTGKTMFSIKENKLTITPLVDECEMRQRAWHKEPFVKVKE